MRAWPPAPDATKDRLLAIVDFHYQPGERPAFIESYGARWCSTATGAFLENGFKGCKVKGWLCSSEELIEAFPARDDDPPETNNQIIANLPDRGLTLLRRQGLGWTDVLGQSHSNTLENWHCSLSEAILHFDLGLPRRAP